LLDRLESLEKKAENSSPLSKNRPSPGADKGKSH
jgi:hypothetical protein